MGRLLVANSLIFYCCVNETDADDVIMTVVLRSDLLSRIIRVLQDDLKPYYFHSRLN